MGVIWCVLDDHVGFFFPVDDANHFWSYILKFLECLGKGQIYCFDAVGPTMDSSWIHCSTPVYTSGEGLGRRVTKYPDLQQLSLAINKEYIYQCFIYFEMARWGTWCSYGDKVYGRVSKARRGNRGVKSLLPHPLYETLLLLCKKPGKSTQPLLVHADQAPWALQNAPVLYIALTTHQMVNTIPYNVIAQSMIDNLCVTPTDHEVTDTSVKSEVDLL